MFKLNRIMVIVFLFVLGVSLIACQPTQEQNATSVDQSESTTDQSNKLIIYSGRSESLVQPLVDQFAAASGLDVEVRYGGTAELAGVLLEEGENSPADLFYAQDPGGLGAVEAAGMLAPLPQDILDQVPARFTAESEAWAGVSGRARTVVYNTNVFTDPDNQLPADMWGFLEPEWNGRIGWAPTNGSFQAMVTAMRKTWGEEKTREWLQGIQANNPVVYAKNTPIVAGVAAGEVDVGFVNHYYLYRFLAEEGEAFPARNQFLSGGPGSLLMVSGAGILETAVNQANAEKFINFLLSTPGQQYFAAQTYEYPVVADVKIESSLPSLEMLDSNALDISLADLADLAGTQDMLLELGIIE